VSPKKFVRSGNVPAGADIHLYDHCRTTLAVGGQATGGVAIGELWLTYDVVALFPRSDESNGTTGLFASYTSDAGSVTQANPFGTGTFVPSTRNTFVLAFNGNSFTMPNNFPACDMYMLITWVGAARVASYVIPAVTSSVNMTNATITSIGLNAGTQGPDQFGRWYRISPTGVNGAIFGVDTASFVGPTTPTFAITLIQVPRVPPPLASSPIFDPLGREQLARYEKMRRALEPALADIRERETSSFALVRVNDDWFVVHPATQHREHIDQQTAKSLTLVSDGLFDTMCVELCTGPRERSRVSG